MKKLSTHISLSIIGLISTGFLIVFFVVDTLVRTSLQEELVQSLQVQCALVDNLLPTSNDSLQNSVERAARDASVRITVISDTGRVLADSDPRAFHKTLENHLNREEIQMAMRNLSGFGFALRHSSSVDDDLVYVAYKSSHYRFVRIARGASFLNDLVWRVRFVFVITAIVALLVLVYFTHHLTARITRPLGSLVKATDQIRNGNYEFLVPQTDNDEIGHLAEMIHAMAARVKGDIDQLKVLQDIRKDFVANASHELRTPVSSIRGYMETLLDGAMHDEQVSRKFLERALSNVIRLETIVNDMLDLSRLESCDRGLSLRYFEVAMIIRNILAEFEDAANRKGVELIYESPLPADFKIMADPYQFDKALINLLENAIKYTEAGYVKVNASAVAQFFVLTIEDSGSGIRAEDIPRIFERFYRADRGRSRQLGGSGLGLSIVRHIMEIHRGTVTVESEVGKGTIFTLRFPQDAELSIPK